MIIVSIPYWIPLTSINAQWSVRQTSSVFPKRKIICLIFSSDPFRIFIDACSDFIVSLIIVYWIMNELQIKMSVWTNLCINISSHYAMITLTLEVLKPEITWQYNGCWCLGSLCHQATSRHDIDYAWLTGACLPPERISATNAFFVLKSD